MDGGGSGSAVVQNTNNTSINDRGAGIAQTGLSNVEGTSPPRATSGSAVATGLITQNSVTNSTHASVIVGGQNRGSVLVQSTNGLAITNSGGASALSGAALSATANAKTLQASAVVNTDPRLSIIPRSMVQAAPARSSDVSRTGLNVSNVTQTTLSSTVKGNRPTGPVSISQSANAAIVNSGQASSYTNGACAGNGCVPAATVGGSATTSPSVTTNRQTAVQASSGSASAVGLQAQNTVNTRANVNVHVGGSNFGIIHVIVQTMTSIINWGSAQAQSGLAAAVNNAMAPPSSTAPGSLIAPAPALATSGDATTIGATVANQVNLSSSVSVQVNGNNYNPIQVLVQLVVNIANRGIGSAVSGDAQALSPNASPGSTARPSGIGPATPAGLTTSAVSGSAQSIGLDAQNQVDLSSDVNIDIAGSNYAPIDVYVVLGSQIDNSGQATASTGQARAATTPSFTAPSSSGATSAASPSSAVTAGSAPADPASVAETGVASSSPSTRSLTGSSKTSSVESAVNATNLQNAVVSSPSSPGRIATNSAAFLVRTQGQTSSVSGGSFTGPIPTPTQISGQGSVPKPLPSGSVVLPLGGLTQGSGTIILHRLPNPGTSNGGSGGPSVTVGSPPNGQPQAQPDNSLTDISLWSVLPDPGLPLMPQPRLPKQRSQTVVRRTAVSQTGQTAMVPVAIVEDPNEAPMPDAQLRATAVPPVQPSSESNAVTAANPAPPPAATKAPVHQTAPSVTAPVNANTNSTNALLVGGLLAAIAVVAAGYTWRRRVWLITIMKTMLSFIHLY